MDPITRKEMFLAKAGGQSVKTPEPITREEMFLQRIAENGGSGGGGGSASIDVTAEVGQTIVVEEVDANGKPTKWKAADYQPRTHWEGEAEMFSGTFDAETLQSGVAAGFELIDGKTYKVMWNGVEYICPVRYIPGDAGENYLALGNVDLFLETGDTGEPFLLVVLFGILTDFGISEYTTAELSITGHNVNVIPIQYLANAMPHYVDILDENSAGNYFTTETPENLMSQYNSGRAIFARLLFGGGVVILPLFALSAFGETARFGLQVSPNTYASAELTATDGVYSVNVTMSGI